MKYIDEFRDQGLVKSLVRKIHHECKDCSLTFMEVCGTHSMSIARFGIKTLLPKNMRLVSGPGCPVCVTPISYIDKAIALAETEKVILTIFGDMLKVPGTVKSLETCRNSGSDIRIVESCLDALRLAELNPDCQVVFSGVGFETTAPTIAVAIQQAHQKGINNFSVLSAHKIMPPALKWLCQSQTDLSGFLCPGHVSTIIGSSAYQSIVDNYGKACVIAGFEPVDILNAILKLVIQVMNKQPTVDNQYKRIVKSKGNLKAQMMLDNVFFSVDTEWRGLGVIEKSGLKIKPEYMKYDSEKVFNIQYQKADDQNACQCGQVLQGKLEPDECHLFAKNCTPDTPVGACMVSSEGACASAFKYKTWNMEQ